MNRLVAPTRRRLDPEHLLREWRRLALRGPWRVASDWLCPEVMALARAVQSPDAEHLPGLRSEIRALGRARAAHGVGAAEAVSDLFMFFEASGMPPSGVLTAAFTEAWAETSIHWGPMMSCMDPATGLSTWGHFRSRIYELYADGIPPRADSDHEPSPGPDGRIIAMIRLPAGSPTLASAGWAVQDAVGQTVRESFAGHSVVLSHVDACLMVLMPRCPLAFNALRECKAALDVVLGAGAAGCRIDVEPLPASADDVDRLLDSLHR